MLQETLFLGFIVLMITLMVLGMVYKIGLFNLLSAGVGVYLMIGVTNLHGEDTNQLIALSIVFFGLIAYNFYYAFWGTSR